MGEVGLWTEILGSPEDRIKGEKKARVFFSHGYQKTRSKLHLYYIAPQIVLKDVMIISKIYRLLNMGVLGLDMKTTSKPIASFCIVN